MAQSDHRTNNTFDMLRVLEVVANLSEATHSSQSTMEAVLPGDFLGKCDFLVDQGQAIGQGGGEGEAGGNSGNRNGGIKNCHVSAGELPETREMLRIGAVPLSVRVQTVNQSPTLCRVINNQPIPKYCIPMPDKRPLIGWTHQHPKQGTFLMLSIEVAGNVGKCTATEPREGSDSSCQATPKDRGSSNSYCCSSHDQQQHGTD